VFLSNRDTPMTRQNVNAMLAKLGREAGIEISRASAHAAPFNGLQAGK